MILKHSLGTYMDFGFVIKILLQNAVFSKRQRAKDKASTVTKSFASFLKWTSSAFSENLFLIALK